MPLAQNSHEVAVKLLDETVVPLEGLTEWESLFSSSFAWLLADLSP